MTTALRWSGILLVLLFLQIAIMPLIGLGNWSPDLALIATIMVAVRRGRNAGQLTGFTLGLLQGLFAAIPFGSQAFALTIAGFLAGSARHLLYRESSFAPAVFTLPASLLVPLLLRGAAQLAGHPAPPELAWQPLPLTLLFALAAGFLPWPATRSQATLRP